MKNIKTICCKGEIISFETPKIMGILNITPDSFYKNSRFEQKEACKQVEKMLKDGADFIDVGGYSSRPGANSVSEQEEILRVVPVIEEISKQFPNVFISVDTFRSEVARQSILAGACIVNDISAGNLDEKMWQVVANEQVPYIGMHMKGTPQTMQNFTQYDNLIQEMIFYFSEKMLKARELGVLDFIIDLGFGFSKTLEQNYLLVKNLEKFQCLNAPILVGISRKSMIYRLLENSPEEALNGTTALHSIALYKGANILRVHDVKQAKECVKIIETLKTI